ncbi:hypothetical protein [Massilia sp. S19_KUP03_FR1]|uniref:hypothetical protein n=1 Tax=Massilia sp. S19_KUP03_FR1 TaxID=3025503 RepID=UPI002FCDDB50
MRRHFFICLLIASAPAFAATPRVFPPFEMNASLDKKNMQFHFTEGAVGGIVNDYELSGIIGMATEFTAQPGGATILFDESVTEERLRDLMNYQGRLEGVVQCKRVRVGTSPEFPQLGVQLMAEGCIIKSINH